MITRLNSKRCNWTISFLLILLLSCIILGFISVENLKRYAITAERDMDEFVSIERERVHEQILINGNYVNEDLVSINNQGQRVNLVDEFGVDTVILFYYDLQMCSACYEKAIEIIRLDNGFPTEEIKIVSKQHNYREFAFKMKKLNITEFYYFDIEHDLYKGIEVDKPVFLILCRGRIMSSLSYSNKLPDTILDEFIITYQSLISSTPSK